MPAVLIEASFISNPKDAQLLSSRKGSRALGKAIGEAVVDYVKQSEEAGAPLTWDNHGTREWAAAEASSSKLRLRPKPVGTHAF